MAFDFENRMGAETIFGEEIIPDTFHSAKRIEATHSRPARGKGSRSYPRFTEMLSGSALFTYEFNRVFTHKQLFHSVN